MAQSPESLNYQAVVRDADGAIRANQVTSVDFNIRQGAADGTIVYSEMHDPTTNEFGLVNVKVGEGTAATGSFAAIDWSAGPYFLEVLLNDVSAGTQEFSSVPFSLYAKRALSAATADEAVFAATAENATNATMADFATAAGTATSATTAATAGTADFATAAGTANDDNDRSPDNEIQTLSVSGNQLSLSADGGTVDLPVTPTYWTLSGENIHSTNNGNVGIKTNSPETTLEITTESRQGDIVTDVEQISTTLTFWAPNVWQSFTATQSGYISSVSVVNGPAGVTGPSFFRIYEGEGRGGATLHQQKYAAFDPGGQLQLVEFPLNTPLLVEAGSKYTLFFPGLNWVQAQAEYAGGASNVGADLTIQVKMVAEVMDNTTLAVGYGRVGIGTNAPREKLEVVGNICYTGTIGACSDERYKKDFASLENTLDKVMQLNGLYYNWKQEQFPEREFTNERQIGVIAQEVETFFPEIVLTGDDGYKSVDYGKLTPILLEAIKEQQAIIEAMQTETNQLRASVLARLDALEGKSSPNTTQIQTSKK